jgi:protocatechuate 3,4-dioxygenase beta subunit
VITGRVTDSDGTPVIGEQIAVTKTNAQEEMWLYETERYRTDDRGIYRIFGLEAGDYRVSVGQENPASINSMTARLGSVFAKTYYPGTTKQSQAKVLELKEGAELSNIDFVVGKLPPGFAVSGRVLDNAGKPVPNVTVGYSSIEGKREWIGSMDVIIPATDADGRFRVEGIHPGKYAAFTLSGPAQPGLYSEVSKFEVIDADVTGIVINLTPGATITGVAVVENNSDPAVFAALQSFRIFAHSQNQERVAAPSHVLSSINNDGSFSFSGLGPGKARFGLQRYPQPPKGFTLSRVELDGVVQETIDVTAGADIKNVRLVFNYGAGSLRGRVKTEGGTLPEGTRLYVTLMQAGQRVLAAPYVEVDARGHFFTENIPPGTYEVRTRIVRARENSSTLAPETQVVTIAHEVETEVTIVLNLAPGNERP